MGADAYIAFYGIDRPFDASSDALSTHARRHGLQTWSGRITDETGHYILIGKRIALLGLENDSEVSLKDLDFQKIAADTKRKLTDAGYSDEPRLIFKFEVDY